MCSEKPSGFTTAPQPQFQSLWDLLPPSLRALRCLCLLVDASFFSLSLSLSFFLFFVFSGPHLWHMEVPRLGVKLELQLLALTTAAATLDLSRVCDLHHSPWQCQILNPLSEVRDRTCVLMDTSQIRFHCTTMGTPGITFLPWLVLPLQAPSIQTFLARCGVSLAPGPCSLGSRGKPAGPRWGARDELPQGSAGLVCQASGPGVE